MALLMRTVSRPDLLEDAGALDAVLATEGWHTLMTFTRESARAYPLRYLFIPTLTHTLHSRASIHRCTWWHGRGYPTGGAGPDSGGRGDACS